MYIFSQFILTARPPLVEGTVWRVEYISTIEKATQLLQSGTSGKKGHPV